jgi:uncharacterized tellurite resistance protein B-like protein
MEDTALAAARHRLEEALFHEEERAALARLRAHLSPVSVRRLLADTTGFSDAGLVSRLAARGLDAGAFAALALVPLLEVAWADGVLEGAEREALLEAASGHGVSQRSMTHGLLAPFLEARPAPALLEAWAAYASQLARHLSPADRQALAGGLLAHARDVAERAGGVLGLFAVSSAEAAVLARVADVLTGGDGGGGRPLLAA